MIKRPWNGSSIARTNKRDASCGGDAVINSWHTILAIPRRQFLAMYIHAYTGETNPLRISEIQNYQLSGQPNDISPEFLLPVSLCNTHLGLISPKPERLSRESLVTVITISPGHVASISLLNFEFMSRYPFSLLHASESAVFWFCYLHFLLGLSHVKTASSDSHVLERL